MNQPDDIIRTLFVYGTLLIDEVIHRVTGRRFPSCKALLSDYARVRLRRSPYPGILPCMGAAVEGLLYFEVDDESLSRIDAFEGRIYERIGVKVATDTGARYRSQAFRIRERDICLLSDRPWDIREFTKRDLPALLNEIDTGARRRSHS